MKVSRLFFGLVMFVSLTTVGCSNSSDKGKVEVHETGNPTAEEVLKLDLEADILQFNGVIYQNGIDWVEKLTLTKGEQVGEIKTKNGTDTNFKDEMSNKLPVGAKIFSVKEKEEIGGPILLVESEDKLYKYYGLVEG
ncbi:hypothetical protein MPH48_20585 [Lysinibacillus fusiformis]|uniref:hypothetical protein n=1 Tax=Lysinibacillus fusiformis TaxID=28031 RepID=UPI001F4D7CFF|nr:hypothetical protein [Lysinibacillus fusiformis]MCK1990485.1 hypothetical protein [Lysinibacillus fusiformis]